MPDYALNDGEWILQYHSCSIFALRNAEFYYTSMFKATLDWFPLYLEGRGTMVGLFLGHVVSKGQTNFKIHGTFTPDLYNFDGITNARIRIQRVDAYPTKTDIILAVPSLNEEEESVFPFVLCYVTFELTWNVGERAHARFWEIPMNRFHVQ